MGSTLEAQRRLNSVEVEEIAVGGEEYWLEDEETMVDDRWGQA